MHLLFFALFELYASSSVHAYPDGSIAAVCDTMIPTHTGIQPQITTPPYTIIVNRTACRPGDVIRVTLESVNSTDFEGFMLQARPTSGKRAVGIFMPGNASLVRLHDCFNAEKSTISHSAANALARLEVTWVAPLTLTAPSEIMFCATFVKNYAEFWTMVTSQTVPLSSSPGPALSILVKAFSILIALGHFGSALMQQQIL